MLKMISIFAFVTTSVIAGFSQTPTPHAKRANERPPKKPFVVVEPFDKADVACP